MKGRGSLQGHNVWVGSWGTGCMTTTLNAPALPRVDYTAMGWPGTSVLSMPHAELVVTELRVDDPPGASQTLSRVTTAI
jgi:hypothetical protein